MASLRLKEHGDLHSAEPGKRVRAIVAKIGAEIQFILTSEVTMVRSYEKIQLRTSLRQSLNNKQEAAENGTTKILLL